MKAKHIMVNDQVYGMFHILADTGFNHFFTFSQFEAQREFGMGDSERSQPGSTAALCQRDQGQWS